MKRITFFIVTILLTLTSCEKVINIDTTISESELVLNAVPSAEKQFFVNFSYTHFFLDTSNYHPVPNMDMVITVNGNEYRPSSTHRCNYFFDYTPQPDDSIAISVMAGNRTVTASTYVPRFPQITTPTVRYDSSGTFNLLHIEFPITDHPNYKNYYRIYITQHDSGAYYHPFLEYLDTIDTIRTTTFFCFDSALIAGAQSLSSGLGVSEFNVPIFSQLLTTDSLFDGTTHPTSLQIMLLRDTNEIQPFIHQYELTIECVTPERMQYLQAIEANNGMMSLITEPPAMYSNVSGALGIFAGTAKKKYPLITLADGQVVPTSGKAKRAKK